MLVNPKHPKAVEALSYRKASSADLKYREALDLALCIVVADYPDETDVTEDDVRGWSEYDLYEWLEAWGYEWCVGGWEYVGFDD